MADMEQNLSLADALSEPPPQIEEEVKRDFMATLEAEKFDDVIGEKVGKTDYVPLLDDDGNGGPKAENQEAKAKPRAENLPRERPSATGPATVVENGDHGLEGSRPEPSGKILEEEMSYKDFLDHNASWTTDDGRPCFASQLVSEPMDVAAPFRPTAPPPHEDFWLDAAHLAEGQGPAPFFASPEAHKVPAEVEEHHPGGDEMVFSGELSPPEAEQAVSTAESMGSGPGETPPVGSPRSVVEEPTLVKSKDAAVHPVEPSAEPEGEVKASAELPSSDEPATLPPSPEKKTKPSATAGGAKPAAPAKSKPGTAGAPPAKRPASATLGANKKTAAPGAAGPASSAPAPKRPSSGLARPSSLTPRELKPKGTDGKIPEKKISPSKTPSAPRPGGKTATPGGSRPATSPSPRAATAAGALAPKKPSAVKTDVKAADAKKASAKSPTADPSRPRSAPASTTASPAPLGASAGRPKPKTVATKPLGSASVPAEPKKPSLLASKALPKTSPGASKPPRPTTSVSVPDLKNIRSKIGSTDNIKHQPGGGKAKVEKKSESALASRKLELGTVSKPPTNKSTVSKEGLAKSPNGKVQILSKRVNYSHVQSKCGSKDNIKHIPGGGNVQTVPKPTSGNKSQIRTNPKPSPGCTNVQILNKKIDLSKVAAKCGSKANLKHKPGGGDVKIENQKLNFKEKAQAKVGSLDNVGHVPAGGTVKTEGDKEAAPENGGPPPGSIAPQENGAGPLAPAQGGGDQREIQSFNTHIQETN